METRASVTHAVPGRLRVRLEGGTAAERKAAMAALRQVEATPGVHDVTADTERGSALVTFDPESLDMESAVKLVREAHEAFDDVAPPKVVTVVDKSVSTVASRIEAGFTSADNDVRKATHGAVDLKMLVPLGLGTLAVRQFIRTGPLVSSMPWYVLAYYSFDTFVKLHGRPRPRHIQSAE